MEHKYRTSITDSSPQEERLGYKEKIPYYTIRMGSYWGTMTKRKEFKRE
jgi:hypothetical protein